jgi:hypothetical protein
MSPELLHLHLSQLNLAFDKSKTNKYADIRKQDYHDTLSELYSKISNEDFFIHNVESLKSFKEILDFIFYSLEFLDNSTLTSIPYEIVYCLEKALKDWVPSEDYIIVTSLQNNIINYSFNRTLALQEHYYDIIDNIYNIKFKKRLIQINLPKYLAQDFLANVVLYHELGHFIDAKYKITDRIAYTLSLDQIETKHYSEFFADIFAAQYIGKSSNYYLNYIAYKKMGSYSHPATADRINIVNDFLNNNMAVDSKLSNLLNATLLTIGVDLKIRFNEIKKDDFLNLIPADIDSISCLHSIFEVGWSLWLNHASHFSTLNLNYSDTYKIINNLIEKSISNYMVLESWNKTK